MVRSVGGLGSKLDARARGVALHWLPLCGWDSKLSKASGRVAGLLVVATLFH